MNDESIITGILESEGWPKYTNDPNDRGGPTKGGITLGTLSEWRGRPCKAIDVEALSEAECRAIYAAKYITKPGFDKIKNDHLRVLVVDAGVLHGQGRAGRWLQEAAGLTGDDIDGQIGPKSSVIINRQDPAALIIQFSVIRIRFIGSIINDNYKARRAGKTSQDQASFALGWLRRATDELLELSNRIRPASVPGD